MVWSVAVTTPQGETRASADLSRVGISTYFPKLAAFESQRGRLIERTRPLFPGYLFWYFTEAWHRLLDADPILGVLMSGERPAQLRDSVIDELRERESADGLIHLRGPKRRRRFRKGANVRMVYGAMCGLTGIVTEMHGDERVRVLMDLLGRQTPVTVRETELAMA